MMTTKRRTDEPQISTITRSGVATGSDKTDGKKETESAWVRKTVEKVPIFYIHK